MEASGSNVDATSKGTNPYGYGTGTEISTTIKLAQDVTIRIKMVASAVNSTYKVKDNWVFPIDGKILDKVEDRDINDGQSTLNQYYEWRDTSFGKYDLAAGEHLFIVKLTGGH